MPILHDIPVFVQSVNYRGKAATHTVPAAHMDGEFHLVAGIYPDVPVGLQRGIVNLAVCLLQENGLFAPIKNVGIYRHPEHAVGGGCRPVDRLAACGVFKIKVHIFDFLGFGKGYIVQPNGGRLLPRHDEHQL